MRHSHYIWTSLLSLGLIAPVFANDSTTSTSDNIINNTEQTPASSTEAQKTSRFQVIKDLKTVHIKDLKVNASAAQPEAVKDPLQPLNRKIFEFNDFFDRNLARPVAVQYKEKVPDQVRGSYRSFRKNLNEPWYATNQLLQGRVMRAVKSVGRFTLNTVTTLGLADPAGRLNLTSEEENFGTTLGYYGVPSGPYIVIPILGPSTFRDGFGLAVDSQAHPQKYILEDHDGLYWSDLVLRGIDIRSQLLDVDGILKGDKYAQIRDIYLQRKNFEIAEKKGDDADSMFISDEDFNDEVDNTLDDENTSNN